MEYVKSAAIFYPFQKQLQIYYIVNMLCPLEKNQIIVEATKWVRLTKVELQISKFVLRMRALYIPSLSLILDT